MPSYQTTRPWEVYVEWMARMTVNPAVITATPIRESDRPKAEKLGHVLTYWLETIQQRTGVRIGEAMSTAQGRDNVGVFMCVRAEEVHPELEYLTRTTPPTGDTAKMYTRKVRGTTGEKECPECQGTGYNEDGLCSGCDGTGMIPDGESEYWEETGEAYLERMNFTYAQAGAPWTIIQIDPLQAAWSYDRDPRGGLKWAAIRYEVSLDEWERSEDISILDVKGEVPAPGFERADSAYTTSDDSPSQTDFLDRVTVNQFWTRDTCIEWVDDSSPDDHVRFKEYPNPYSRVPIFILPAIETPHDDPAWRYRGPFDAMLMLKPYFDDFHTILLGTARVAMDPEVFKVIGNQSSGTPNFAADGASINGEGAVGSSQLGVGEDIRQIQVQMTAAIPESVALLRTAMEEAKPQTGRSESAPGAQAWNIKLKQEENNVQPAQLLTKQRQLLQDMFEMIFDYHLKYGAPFLGFTQKDGKVDKTRVIKVEADECRGMSIFADISAITAEQTIVQTEYVTNLVRLQLETPVTLYRDAMNKPDPEDYDMRVRGYYAAQPAVTTLTNAKLAQVLGSEAIVGGDGMPIDPISGMRIPPEQAISQKGFKPQSQGMRTMPDLQGMPDLKDPSGQQPDRRSMRPQ
jgi:hypothetical protein